MRYTIRISNDDAQIRGVALKQVTEHDLQRSNETLPEFFIAESYFDLTLCVQGKTSPAGSGIPYPSPAPCIAMAAPTPRFIQGGCDVSPSG